MPPFSCMRHVCKLLKPFSSWQLPIRASSPAPQTFLISLRKSKVPKTFFGLRQGTVGSSILARSPPPEFSAAGRSLVQKSRHPFAFLKLFQYGRVHVVQPVLGVMGHNLQL